MAVVDVDHQRKRGSDVRGWPAGPVAARCRIPGRSIERSLPPIRRAKPAR